MPDDPNDAPSRGPKKPGTLSPRPGTKAAEQGAPPASPADPDDGEHADHATEEAAAYRENDA